ncbi:ATP-binding cassette domain-containing protein [Streptomyces sp. NBC_01538]|uniref:ABC transporter ATP-binding protein n=1 Tax=Streptomyces sp. NBC_01538 TaxID=2903897 RepID=UPI00386B204B
MTSAEEAVRTRDLVKWYPKRDRPAVDGLTFSVARGEIFGLLGPNGAGKTTTIGVLTTRVVPTEGEVSVGGVDLLRDGAEARRRLAVVSQHNNLDRGLTIHQNLLMHGLYHGLSRTERRRRAGGLLEEMGLADRAGAKVGQLSGGQQQRVKIARALMHEPSVLFVDEPSTGLDPQSRLFVYDKLTALHARGVTVVITTHDMEEAARLCDRVGIMDHGRLIALDTPKSLTASLPGGTAVDLAVDGDAARVRALAAALGAEPGVSAVESGQDDPPGRLTLHTTADPTPLLARVLHVIGEHGCEVRDVGVRRPSLEDVFIRLTGRGIR